MSNKRICIVGGAGFVGTQLALALHQSGDDVYVLDNFSVNNIAKWVADQTPYRDRYMRILNDRVDLLRAADIPLLSVDARDYHELSKQLAKAAPHVLIHLAAISHQGKSNKARDEAWRNSLDTLKNSLDYAIGARLDHFIWNSSSLRYGSFQGEALEHSPLNPVGWYGCMKVMGELAIKAAQSVHGLPYTILVPSALYGPRCVSRRVVQIFIENILDGEVLTIEGTGAERLDFTYIDDYIEAVRLVVDQPDASRNQIFNVTRGESRSMNELVGILRVAFAPRDIIVTHSEKNKDYPTRDTLNTEKIQNLLGYESRWPLESGVYAYAQWYKEFLNGT